MNCTTGTALHLLFLVMPWPSGWQKLDCRPDKHISTLYLLKNHNLIFLGLAMAAGKAIADPAHDVEYSTMVTAMCRNGIEFGIRVSGLGDEWFTAPSPFVNGLYVRVSLIEMPVLIWAIQPSQKRWAGAGLCWVAHAGILSLVGGTPKQALAYSREMRTITIGVHPTYKMPVLGLKEHRPGSTFVK